MTVTALAAPPSRCPASLTGAIRRAVGGHADWGQTAQRVAVALRGNSHDSTLGRPNS